MSQHINLSDPAFEPSDEDLRRLMHGAFNGIREAHEQSLFEMRARIARLEVEARARFDARWRAPKDR